MTDTLLTQGERSVLRMERSFAHRVETVWGALINTSHLNAWYPAKVEMEPRPGGAINLDYGHGIVTTGAITAIDGPQVFAFTERGQLQPGKWSRGEIRFELHPEVGGTLLVFRQTFGDRKSAAKYAAGWQTCFDALDLLLAGKPVRREPVSTERVARYNAIFGLDG